MKSVSSAARDGSTFTDVCRKNDFDLFLMGLLFGFLNVRPLELFVILAIVIYLLALIQASRLAL